MLLASAESLFADRGYHAVSIEQVCAHAGFTRGAFYSNFQTKDALFLALFDARGAAIVDRLQTAMDHSRGAADPITDFLAAVSQDAEEDRRWYLISTEFTLHAVRNRPAAEALAAHDARIRAHLVTLINEVLARAGRQPTIEVEVLARFATAVREGNEAQAYVEPDILGPRDFEQQFLAGVLETWSRPID